MTKNDCHPPTAMGVLLMLLLPLLLLLLLMLQQLLLACCVQVQQQQAGWCRPVHSRSSHRVAEAAGPVERR
jgi:hypothetical protein